jgi:hypothetical protein
VTPSPRATTATTEPRIFDDFIAVLVDAVPLPYVNGDGDRERRAKAKDDVEEESLSTERAQLTVSRPPSVVPSIRFCPMYQRFLASFHLRHPFPWAVQREHSDRGDTATITNTPNPGILDFRRCSRTSTRTRRPPQPIKPRRRREEEGGGEGGKEHLSAEAAHLSSLAPPFIWPTVSLATRVMATMETAWARGQRQRSTMPQ